MTLNFSDPSNLWKKWKTFCKFFHIFRKNMCFEKTATDFYQIFLCQTCFFMFLFEKVLKSEGGVIAILDLEISGNFWKILDMCDFRFENVSKMFIRGYQEYVFCIFGFWGSVSDPKMTFLTFLTNFCHFLLFWTMPAKFLMKFSRKKWKNTNLCDFWLIFAILALLGSVFAHVFKGGIYVSGAFLHFAYKQILHVFALCT